MARKRKPAAVLRRSFFLKYINKLTAFIYSLFASLRMAERLSFGDRLYEESYLAGLGKKISRSARGLSERYAEGVIEQSRMLRLASALRDFLAALGLNVYGIFFMAYSLTAIFLYYIVLVLEGGTPHGISAVVVAIVCFVCSLPLMVTSRSLSSVVSESRIMRMLLLSFMGIPEEKMKGTRSVSGTEYMFMSAVIAVLCGIFTYFVHPAYIPLTFVVLTVIFLVSANPESGVILTIAATPFLQFSDLAEELLVAMLLLTAISYVGKLIRRRRIITMSAEIVFLLIFSVFILMTSLFSKGGGETLWDGVLSVILMLGGFILSYNLMRGEKHISSCVKIMMVTFLILCGAGLWNVFYNGIADGVMYSMRENVRPILESNIIYIADGVPVFSVYAVLTVPMLFAYMARRRSVRSVAFSIILMALAVATAFIYGSYETIVALAVEFCLFWMLYSHKSLTALILAAIPIAICVILYPYLSVHLGLPNIAEVIERLMPLPFADSATHQGVIHSTLEMIRDGHLAGIGVGEHAFMSYYPAYSDVISSDTTSSVTLWLKILCWSGLGGLITFALLAVYMLINSMGYLMRARQRSLRCDSLALFCGVFTAILFGTVSGVWANGRMLYLFWVCAGLLAGSVREGRAEELRSTAAVCDAPDAGDTELRF